MPNSDRGSTSAFEHLRGLPPRKALRQLQGRYARRMARVIDLLAELGTASTPQLAARCGCARETMARTLKWAWLRGLVRRTGLVGHTRWSPVDAVDPSLHQQAKAQEGDRIAQVRRLRLEGLTDPEIAGRMDISATVVGNVRRRLGLPRVPRPSRYREAVLELAAQGLRPAEIAERLGCAAGTAQKLIRKARESGQLSAGLASDGRPETTRHRVARLATLGHPDREIAELMGLSRSEVAAHRNRSGVKPAQSRESNVSAVLPLVQAGRFVEQIADELGVSTHTVYRCARMAGVRARAGSRAEVRDLVQARHPGLLEALDTTPVEALRRHHGMSVSTVLHYRKRLFGDRRIRKPVAERQAALRRRYPELQGVVGTRPDTEIAAELGMDPSTIGRVRRAFGVPAFRRSWSGVSPSSVEAVIDALAELEVASLSQLVNLAGVSSDTAVNALYWAQEAGLVERIGNRATARWRLREGG